VWGGVLEEAEEGTAVAAATVPQATMSPTLAALQALHL
jgi:hypothetical protein